MEKDLRDAYAALKLLRADLVKTRRDKRALEASLTHLQAHGPPPSAAQGRASREVQQMQQEDFNSQLWRMAAQYEARLGEVEQKLGQHNCQKKEKRPEIGDNQQEEEENQEEEEEGVEKLALLNKLHSLTATVEQQTQTMLAQQAAFALQKGELETRLEDAQHALQTEKSKVADAVLEQQAAKEKYAFLETQVEILMEEKTKLQEEKKKVESKLAAHAQTSGILKQQLQEKDQERKQLETDTEERELELHLEHKQKMDVLVEEVSLRARQENELKEKELREKFERQVAELQQSCGVLERELSSVKEHTLQDLEKVQERHLMKFRDLESKCTELQKKLEESESERVAEAENHAANLVAVQKEYSSALSNLENSFTGVRAELADAKSKQAAEAREHDLKISEASEKMRDQEKTHEKLTLTLRDLERTLEDVRSQLAAADTKLAEQTMQHEENLVEASRSLQAMQDANNQHVVKLHDLESKLAESESNRLEHEAKFAEASQLAAQHEKTARALAMEKKALQQEVREARQTSKLTTEEFLSCQAVMEQKTQEHLSYLTQVQEQCESLETQLLAAEDHELAPAAKPVDGSYTLKAFHGLSDNEIASLPPSKSWKLLRSGINEMDGFLPHLQTLLGAMSETLKLCESHADILPTLCERLQGKVASEKGESSILSFALRVLRFAVMLKARIKQEEAPLDQKTVFALHRRVLTALAQWYECDAGDNGNGSMPIPTFTITSRETALILHNWTHDRSKLLGVRRWLARMEAYPGVPPLKGASSNRVLELPPEGCTLELEDMTPEVKDAFRLLLIPILKQNRALHVRVFTRYTADASVKKQQQQTMNGDGDSNEDSAEKAWAMRIHVQSAVTQRRSSGSARPTPLNLTSSPHGPPSPLAPTSPASSVSSSTSSTASSRLQIIQERLQYLHNNG